MLKNKSLLTGIGLGMILGAVLLQLTYSVPSPGEKPLQGDAATVAEKVYSQQEVDALLRQDREEQRQAWEKEAKQQDNLQNAVPASGGTEGASSAGLIVIVPGEGSQSVAEKLLEAGLIDDKRQFEDRLGELKLSRTIQPGEFTFEDRPDIDEIISRITSR